MEFCSEKCLRDFLLAECSKCAECAASIAVDVLADCSRRIGAELKHFCSSLCAEKCETNASLCEFCFGVRAVDGNKAIPCSERCEKLSKIITSGEKALAEGKCTDCETFHRYETELIYRGEIFGFCSFKCFFFLKFTCGIYAGNSFIRSTGERAEHMTDVPFSVSTDQCVFCELYFERQRIDDYTVFHNDFTHIFCSASCARHFVLKHNVPNMCTVCSELKGAFDMIRLVDEKGGTTFICSQTCWTQLATQSQCQKKKMLEDKFREFLYTCVPPLPLACDASTQTDSSENNENDENQNVNCWTEKINHANGCENRKKKRKINDEADAGIAARRPLMQINALKRPFKCVDQEEDCAFDSSMINK